jgi:tetratricopeptide (TPR) repeat protein
MGANPSTSVPSPSVIPEPGAAARPLWQVPVFLAGATALAVVWFLRAPTDSGPRQAVRQLAHARQILSRPDGDAEAAAQAAQHALDVTGPDGDLTGEAYFLLGTARMRQGDHTNGEAGKPHWVAARQAFEEADHHGVSADDDKRHLRYRLAKVCFHTGDDPRHVAELLAAAASEAEDGAEAYDLLSQAYLLQNPPDYQKALEANTKLREQSVLRDDMLAKVKLRSGELKLKLGHAEDARKDLELIGPSAPPAVISRARLLRARSYQEESKWNLAAEQWQAALSDAREPPANRTEVLYLLGVCHRRLNQTDEALKAWDDCVRSGAGTAEAVAAAVQLAELRLERKEYDAALELLASATAAVRKPADWNNPYVDRGRALEALEKAAKTFREAGQFELALKLAGDFERLAPPARALTLRAEAATEWAQKRKGTPDGAKPSPEEEQEALNLLRDAGDAFLAAGNAVAPEDESHFDLLWKAAYRFSEAKDLSRAVSTLEQVLKEEKRPKRLGEGWFLLGEARRQSKDLAAAEAAYIECVKYPPFAYRACNQLAQLYWDSGRADQARDTLVQNLAQLRFDRDAEALEKSLYMLGNFAFQLHEYLEVTRRLEEALGQFPSNPEQTRARYQLAESYRQLATDAKRDELLGDSPNPEYIKHLREKHRHFLQKAADEYQELAGFLEKPESAGHLTADERKLIPFTAALCRFNLGQYPEALSIYDHLIEQNISVTVTLQALGGAARCHFGLQQGDKMRQRLDEIRKGIASLDKPQQQEWEEWLSTFLLKPDLQ